MQAYLAWKAVAACVRDLYESPLRVLAIAYA